MFFPEKIKNIKENDRVLEIGPGGTPFQRSDVFLELNYDNEEIFKLQRGNTEKLITEKPVFFYNGSKFPFSDGEFDYIVCSHVLEHVENISLFLSEIFRVSSKGYFEYPTIIYEYLFNIDVHVNIIKFERNTLYYMKKSETNLMDFKAVQLFFLNALENGYDSYVNDLKEFMFEGFEWSRPFKCLEINDIAKFICNYSDIQQYHPIKKRFYNEIIQHMKTFLQKNTDCFKAEFL